MTKREISANRRTGRPSTKGPRQRSKMLLFVLSKVESYSWLAKELGIAPQSLWKWKDIPIKHVVEIEKIVGIPREQLRPDVFRRLAA